jgi:hypothetical protein
MTVDVKTRISVDEGQAVKALDKTKKAFAANAKEAEKTSTAIKDFVKNAASTAAGVYLPKMVSGAYDMAKSFFEVAAAGQESTKNFVGMYSMFRNIPFEEATAEAKKMKTELADMALEIGEKPADAYASFQTLTRAMGADTAADMELAKKQTKSCSLLPTPLALRRPS